MTSYYQINMIFNEPLSKLLNNRVQVYRRGFYVCFIYMVGEILIVTILGELSLALFLIFN